MFMKYLYTVLDRQKQGNTSVYLVKNLKTNEQRIMPISWVRKEYPKGVFSNISISEDGRVSIVKDKIDILDKLMKKVKIVEFLDDAKLDGLKYTANGRYATKEIEILKPTLFLETVILNCVRIDEDTVYFIRNTPKGELVEDEEVVGLRVDWSDSHGYGEVREKIVYPENMNEETCIRFEVRMNDLKDFLKKKQISLTSKELKRLESAIIYSLLYYCHEWVCNKVKREAEDEDFDIICCFEKSAKLDDGEYRSGIYLEESDEKVLKRYSKFKENLPDCFRYIAHYLDVYDKKKTDDVIIFYNDRVMKDDYDNDKLKYEIYACSGYFYIDLYSYFGEPDDRDYEDYRDYHYYKDMQDDY